MGQDWPVDGLEFLNFAGTHRFRLSQPVRGPILLLRAQASDSESPFKIVKVSSENAIPVLALLALAGGEIRKKDWIYDVIWGGKDLDW